MIAFVDSFEPNLNLLFSYFLLRFDSILGVKVVKKAAKSDLDSDLSIRLRFVPGYVLSKTAFCLSEDQLLRFAKPNGEALRKCILSGPYKPTTVLVQAVEATDDFPAIPEHTTPEWSRFVTIVKQQHKLDEVSYHKLFDILKQYNNEVNELRAERLARNANSLALEIAKPITPPSETAFEEDSDPEQAQRDKDMQKNLALIAKYFKKIYKPTNNNLRTSLNSKNKNVDTTLRFKNDSQSGKFRNQRKVNVASVRENECRKPKRVKDSAYHKEKMLLCKQAEQGVPLQAEQYDWLEDTDEEVDETRVRSTLQLHGKDPGETSKSLGESISVRDSCLVALQTKQAEFEKYKAFNDRTVDYDKFEQRIELDLEARLMGETLVLNRSLDLFFEDYIELNDLNESFELRRNQGDNLMLTIEKGMITIYNGNDEVTYQMVLSHSRFKHHTNEGCNKIPPLQKVSDEDKKNGISHPYQKLKVFYKEVLNLGPDYIQDAKTKELHTYGQISMHELEW
nr:hypothetical protein [Tanacetum cinerariifolium]